MTEAGRKPSVALRRLAFELLVVLVGVFLAIRLEGWAGDAAERRAALATLEALRTEIEADRRELDAIYDYQEVFAANMRRLASVLRDGPAEDSEEVQTLITRDLTPNRTWFPQSAAYTTLVTTGQIGAFANSDLQVQLARLHQRSYGRLVYNGELYDKAYLEEFKRSVTRHWDYGSERLFGASPEGNRDLSNVAMRTAIWADSYQSVLREAMPEVDAVLVLIERELAGR